MSRLQQMIDVVDTEFARGNWDAEVIAREWLDAGFSPEAAAEWVGTARCWTADAAVALRDLGITPEQASRRPEAGEESYGYQVANGDMSAERASDILRGSR